MWIDIQYTTVEHSDDDEGEERKKERKKERIGRKTKENRV